MKVKHFLLIHGACLGAWCWYKLMTLLQEAGHIVTALDLAASGRNRERLEDLGAIDEYHKPLYSFMEAFPTEDKVIIVGHSMGGYAVSSAMERFPEKIDLAVFVSAYMLGPDLPMEKLAQRFSPGPDYYMDSEQITVGNFEDTQTIILFGDEFLAKKVYQNSPPEVKTSSNIMSLLVFDKFEDTQAIILFGDEFLAKKVYQNSPPEDLQLATLSTRPTKFFSDHESNKQLLVTKEKYGLVRRAYFIGGSDDGIPVDVQRWMIENNPPDVAKEIKGADHMVMISKVQELCNNLLEIS